MVSSSLKSLFIWKQNFQVCERVWGHLKIALSIIRRDIPAFQQQWVPNPHTVPLTFSSHLDYRVKQSWERCLVAFQIFRFVNWAKWMSHSFDSLKKYENWKPHLKELHTVPRILCSSKIQQQCVQVRLKQHTTLE